MPRQWPKNKRIEKIERIVRKQLGPLDKERGGERVSLELTRSQAESVWKCLRYVRVRRSKDNAHTDRAAVLEKELANYKADCCCDVYLADIDAHIAEGLVLRETLSVVSAFLGRAAALCDELQIESPHLLCEKLQAMGRELDAARLENRARNQ